MRYVVRRRCQSYERMRDEKEEQVGTWTLAIGRPIGGGTGDACVSVSKVDSTVFSAGPWGRANSEWTGRDIWRCRIREAFNF